MLACIHQARLTLRRRCRRLARRRRPRQQQLLLQRRRRRLREQQKRGNSSTCSIRRAARPRAQRRPARCERWGKKHHLCVSCRQQHQRRVSLCSQRLSLFRVSGSQSQRLSTPLPRGVVRLVVGPPVRGGALRRRQPRRPTMPILRDMPSAILLICDDRTKAA